MEFLDAAAARFQSEGIARARRIRLRRQWVHAALYSLPALILIALAVDYLANYPRERALARASYWARVQYGFGMALQSIVLISNAPQDDPKQSRIPIAEIFIEGSDLEAIESALPKSGLIEHPARIKLDGEVFKANVRLRGDSVNHWAFPVKSWRVDISGTDTFHGIEKLNLALPRAKSQIENWLGYAIAKKMGLLAPYAELVHFRLNRRFDGVRLLFEQPNYDLLIRNKLPIGRIFHGDIDTETIYSGKARKALYEEPDAWRVDVPPGDTETVPVEMRRLIAALQESDPKVLYSKLESILDIDAMARYMAMLEIVSSKHIDNSHNGKFYLNPENGRLTPIVWDTVAYLWKDKPIDEFSNELFTALLSIPPVQTLKDRYLWQALTGDFKTKQLQGLVQNKVDEIRPEIEASALKLDARMAGIDFVSNAEWEGEIRNILQTIDLRGKLLRGELEKSGFRYQLSNDGILQLEVFRREGIELDSVLIQFGNSEKKFEFHQNLYSGRRWSLEKDALGIFPARYEFPLNLPKGAVASVKEIVAKNLITGVPVQASPSAKEPAAAFNVGWRDEVAPISPQVKRFGGRFEITQDLVIDKLTTLRIDPDSVIVLRNGASIVIDGGKLLSLGTKDRPVLFDAERGAKSGGGVLLLRGAQGEAAHTIFKGGRGGRYQLVKFQGGLSVFNSKLKIEDSKIEVTPPDFRTSEISQRNVEINLGKDEFLSKQLEGDFIGIINSEDSTVQQKDFAQGGYLHRVLLDTADRQLAAKSFTYALEYRFKDQKTYDRFVKHPERPRFWPTAMRFFAENKESGQTAELVFADSSAPFGETWPAPLAPWPAAEFVAWLAKGQFRGVPHAPGRLVNEIFARESVDARTSQIRELLSNVN